MLDIILDTLIDALKLLPFLFVAFLLLEFIEHKLSKKNKDKVSKAGKLGPLVGSLLGAVPQCGFGSMATNLYSARVISLGTLISIYLSTSDEMLPIMLSENVELPFLLKILGIKILIGMVCGFIIDLIYRKKEKEHIKDICEEEHCHCEHGILKSSLKHTLNILVFIIVISFLLNIGMEFLGEDILSKIFMKDNIFGPFISSLIGLIPNCGSSVALTELYLNEAIDLGSLIGGLLTGAGVGLLILFKTNKNIKENINIVLTLYVIGVISGILINIIL
nr:arsenic efflux protein [Bacilli bacterium]